MDLHTYIQSSKPEPRKATSSLIMIMIMIVMIIMILIMIMIIMIMLHFLPEHSRLLSPHRPTLLPSSKELKQMMMMMTVMMIMMMTMMTIMMMMMMMMMTRHVSRRTSGLNSCNISTIVNSCSSTPQIQMDALCSAGLLLLLLLLLLSPTRIKYN